MFLPTESIYAEVLRSDGLQSYMHQTCRVMAAGPTNLYALLTSFRLGFRILNLQRKGDEVWKVLAATQTEFGKFGSLIDKMDKQVGTVQNTIRDIGTRTRAINRTLREVSDPTAISSSLELEDFTPTSTLSLAASEEED
jgi:DNA recombination protein RmuC